ncbi:hypothetical protein [Corynebacterium ulcerans]|uniref:hypothetical protein n=1 Tax=Corynebacterium ulcerans TaxID=65058 RepID=UPI0015E15395|nr:hypothetical protein [Corynebacterium ulcerans]
MERTIGLQQSLVFRAQGREHPPTPYLKQFGLYNWDAFGVLWANWLPAGVNSTG